MNDAQALRAAAAALNASGVMVTVDPAQRGRLLITVDLGILGDRLEDVSRPGALGWRYAVEWDRQTGRAFSLPTFASPLYEGIARPPATSWAGALDNSSSGVMHPAQPLVSDAARTRSAGA